MGARMRVGSGATRSLGLGNPPVPGCTVSERLHHVEGLSVTLFSLAGHTDISAETYAFHKVLVVCWGRMEAYAADGRSWPCAEGDAFLMPPGVPVGVRTADGCVYTEITLEGSTTMHELLRAGEAIRLADLLPYQDGKVVNMDLAHNERMKLALMSFSSGTGLDEHATPGEALVFALDGEGVIGYEGEEHVVRAGENFKFDKGGRHFVRADKPFKMALLLTF